MSDERFGAIGEVDEKQLRLLVRDWRRGRADRNLFQAIQDAYVMVFALVLIGGHGDQFHHAGPAQRGGLLGRVLPGRAGPAALGRSRWFLAMALVAARMFGPVVARPPRVSGSWTATLTGAGCSQDASLPR